MCSKLQNNSLLMIRMLFFPFLFLMKENDVDPTDFLVFVVRSNTNQSCYNIQPTCRLKLAQVFVITEQYLASAYEWLEQVSEHASHFAEG